jgi:hypothetical protein
MFDRQNLGVASIGRRLEMLDVLSYMKDEP